MITCQSVSVLGLSMLHFAPNNKTQEFGLFAFLGWNRPHQPSLLLATQPQQVYVEQAATVSSFPDRLRYAGWKVVKLS